MKLVVIIAKLGMKLVVVCNRPRLPWRADLFCFGGLAPLHFAEPYCLVLQQQKSIAARWLFLWNRTRLPWRADSSYFWGISSVTLR